MENSGLKKKIDKYLKKCGIIIFSYCEKCRKIDSLNGFYSSLLLYWFYCNHMHNSR